LTKGFVVLIIGNSKSNHLGAQGAFKGAGLNTGVQGSVTPRPNTVCSACGSTHTESGKLYRKVKHRRPPKSLLTPTAKTRPIGRRSRRSQGRGAPHTEHGLGVHSHSGHDEKRPTVKFASRRCAALRCTLAFTRYCDYQSRVVHSIQDESSEGSRILPNNRTIVLHQAGQCRWAGE